MHRQHVQVHVHCVYEHGTRINYVYLQVQLNENDIYNKLLYLCGFYIIDLVLVIKDVICLRF